MSDTSRTIFRPAAVRRYLQDREAAVLPRFVSPRLWLYLWLIVALLVAGVAAAWNIQIPVYAAGYAIITEQRCQGPADELTIVVFLPPEQRAHLRVGQPVFLRSEPTGAHFSRPIAGVEPRVMSPAVAQQAFALGAQAPLVLKQPSAVAVARFGLAPADLPVESYVGSVYRAEVEIESRHIVSLLPLIGQLFGA
jgi:hypothetical protein